jgi:hypothetical protein
MPHWFIKQHHHHSHPDFQRMFPFKLLLHLLIILATSTTTTMVWGRLDSHHHHSADTPADVGFIMEGQEEDLDQHGRQTTEQRSLIQIMEPTIFGSGCPTPQSARFVIPEYAVGEGVTMKISFKDYEARTSNDSLRDYKSCNMALPMKIPAGVSVGISKVDYFGWAFVPGDAGADKPYARLDAEYFFAGSRGPTISKTYGKRNTDFNGKIHEIVDEAITWSACGGDSGGATNFRINTSLVAYKPDSRDRNVFIKMDRQQVDGMNFSFRTRRC